MLAYINTLFYAEHLLDIEMIVLQREDITLLGAHYGKRWKVLYRVLGLEELRGESLRKNI